MKIKEFIKEIIVKSDWWDIVDLLASNCIGAICINFNEFNRSGSTRVAKLQIQLILLI